MSKKKTMSKSETKPDGPASKYQMPRWGAGMAKVVEINVAAFNQSHGPLTPQQLAGLRAYTLRMLTSGAITERGLAAIDTRTTKVQAARASAEVRSQATDQRHEIIRAAFAKLPEHVPKTETVETLAENMECSKSTVYRALKGRKRRQEMT